jgi:hypothetical protein
VLDVVTSGAEGETDRAVHTEVHAVLTAGRTPEIVARDVEQELRKAEVDGMELIDIQPVIYNASTTGYLLLILSRT